MNRRRKMVKRFQKKKNSAGGRKTNLGPVGFISLEESLTLYMYKGYGNARSTIFDYSLCCIREIDMRVLLSFLHQCILWVLLFCLSLVYIYSSSSPSEPKQSSTRLCL
jgi:hypothetical protein